MGKSWAGLLFLKAFTWILFCGLVILIDTRPEIQSSKELLVTYRKHEKLLEGTNDVKHQRFSYFSLCCPLLSHPILSSIKNPDSNQRSFWLKTVLKHKPNRKKIQENYLSWALGISSDTTLFAYRPVNKKYFLNYGKNHLGASRALDHRLQQRWYFSQWFPSRLQL